MHEERNGRTAGWRLGAAVVAMMAAVVLVVSVLEGAENPPPGSSKRLPRMYDGAPPQIPHTIAGLQGLCLGCHLEGVERATIVPHPDRPNCLQCHVPQDLSVKPMTRNTFGGPAPGGK